MTSKQHDTAVLSIIASNMRRLRGGRSLQDVATEAKTFPASIKRIEDRDHMPGAGLLVRIANALHVSVAELYQPIENSAQNRRRKKTPQLS